MWRDVAGLRAENNDLKDDLGDTKKALRQSEDSTRRALERAEAMEEQVNSNGQDELKRLSDELKEREARCDRLHSFQWLVLFCFVLFCFVFFPFCGGVKSEFSSFSTIFVQATNPGNYSDPIGSRCCKVSTSP